MEETTTPRRKRRAGSHGMSGTPEYLAWTNAKQRCTNPKDPAWENYGGRGIRMCRGWLDSSDSFLDGMGLKPTPDASIDRIDNDGHYSCGHCDECQANGWPMNCRWTDQRAQRNNQRRAQDEPSFARNGVTLKCACPQQRLLRMRGRNPDTGEILCGRCGVAFA